MKTGDKGSPAALRRKRNLKCLAYIVIGIILQTLIILVFVLTILRIRNLKVRFGSVSVQDLTLDSSSSPSFNMKLDAQVAVKNKNFGHYKFQNTTAVFSYKGTPVGEVVIGKARVKARSTKKVSVTVTLTSAKVPISANLGGDINSGKITLSAHARLDGKVHLLKVIKKKKSAQLNCTMDVNTKTKAIENLHC